MIILSLIPLLMVLGNSVLIPGLPEMQSQMHVSKFQVSLLITLFSVPAGIIIPVAGFLSDRIGRKLVIIPSMLLFGIGGVLAGCAAWWMENPYLGVMIGRVIQGIGASGTAPIAMAFLGDLFTGSNRSKALGVNEAGNALGKVISPVIGAAVALISWFSVFFIFPVLCLPLAAAVWWLIPEKKKQQEKQSVKEYTTSLLDIARREGRWLLVAYLSGVVSLFTLFGVLFYMSDLLESKYHIDGLPKGLLLAIPLFVLSVTSYVTGSLIKKRKQLMKWLLVVGGLVMSGSLLTSTWLANNAWILIALMSAAAIGTGIVLPSLNMLITSAVNQKSRGIVTSFYGSVRFLGVAAGPPVFTWLMSISTKVMFLSVSVLPFICAVLTLFFIRPETDTPKGKHPLDEGAFAPKLPGRHKSRA